MKRDKSMSPGDSSNGFLVRRKAGGSNIHKRLKQLSLKSIGAYCFFAAFFIFPFVDWNKTFYKERYSKMPFMLA